MTPHFNTPITRLEAWKADPIKPSLTRLEPITRSRDLANVAKLLHRDASSFYFEDNPRLPWYVLHLHTESTSPQVVEVVGSVVMTDQGSFLYESDDLWEFLEKQAEAKEQEPRFHGKGCAA